MKGNLEENYTTLYDRGLQVCVLKQLSEIDFLVCLHFSDLAFIPEEQTI